MVSFNQIYSLPSQYPRYARGPEVSVAPAITGTVEIGQVVTCSTGTWTGSPTSYAYAWYVNNVEDGALGTANNITLTAYMSTDSIKCEVTATNAFGSTATFSNTIVVPLTIPVNLTAPVLSGTVAIGNTLTTTDGTWLGVPSSYTYAWYVDNVLTPSLGTANSIVITPALALTSVKCKVTATNATGSTATDSNAIAISVAPYNTVAPAITGVVDIGETITCGTGTWAGTPSGYAYAWYVDDVLTGGLGTANNITIDHTLSEKDIKCHVTATNAFGSTAAFSNTVAVPLSPPVNTVAPVLSGTPDVGETLTCTTGTWLYVPTEYAYAWFVDNVEDPTLGTANSIVVPVELASTDVKCRVTATNASGSVYEDSNVLSIGSAYTPGLDFSDPLNSMYTSVIAA